MSDTLSCLFTLVSFALREKYTKKHNFLIFFFFYVKHFKYLSKELYERFRYIQIRSHVSWLLLITLNLVSNRILLRPQSI